MFGALFFVGGAVLATGDAGAWSRNSRLLPEAERTQAALVCDPADPKRGFPPQGGGGVSPTAPPCWWGWRTA